MQLMIRNNTAAPIYQQIYQQIKEQIINGTLEEDTMLPSIRSLAKELRISIITTKRAYEELERGWICLYHCRKRRFCRTKKYRSPAGRMAATD